MSVTQTATSPQRPALGAGAFRLLVLHGPTGRNVGQTAVPGSRLVIGRTGQSPNQLVLDDAEVSRRHAIVECDGGALTMCDADSRNGTFVNGVRIERVDVRDGDVVRIGGHLLLVQRVPDATAPCEPVAPDPNIVGRSHRLLALLRQIQHAPAVPALVVGETGVGKEIVAQAMHRNSERTGPLVTVNCAALPDQLAESELFGHVAGAFTGANDRRGLFVEADGGTLLLDEIGEMPQPLQAKLLRALATGEIRPVGADRPRLVDVRVIGATNRDLRAEVECGAFRADLYARLMGLVLEVPPLRARREDILELSQHFLGLAGATAALTADAAEALLIHDWPFNVRELEQLARALGDRKADARAIDLDDLPASLQGFFAPRRGPATTRPNFAAAPVLGVPRRAPPTAPELQAALAAFDGNVAKVASYFGKDRRQIYRWAERLEVDIDGARAERDSAKPS